VGTGGYRRISGSNVAGGDQPLFADGLEAGTPGVVSPKVNANTMLQVGSTLGGMLQVVESVVVGGALAAGATDGFLYVPSIAGTPTAFPRAQNPGGLGATYPMAYDATNHRLWIHDDNTWWGVAANGVWDTLTATLGLTVGPGVTDVSATDNQDLYFGYRSGSHIYHFQAAPAGADLLTLSASGLVLADGINLPVGTATGTQIGTATGQRLAFHGATPVVQRAGAAQTAVATTSSTNTAPYGYTTQAQADSIVTLLNEIRATLVEKGIMKGSA
jgi:hypothetical protein